MENLRRNRRRRAFTLIEVLVVIVVIGLLMGLVIPAVQSAREAARRAECWNHLRQIGVALSGHQAALGAYPNGILPNGKSPGGMVFAAVTPLSLHAQLLNYLEQTALFNAINLSGADRWPNPAPVVVRSANTTATGTTLDVFLCPSDRRTLTPGCNYRGCTGPNPYLHEHDVRNPVLKLLDGGGGVFPGVIATSSRDATDGLSQTIAFSERSLGGGNSARFAPRRDLWLSGVSNIYSPKDADEMAAVCRSLKSRPSAFRSSTGDRWILGGLDQTLYNHVSPPNDPAPDCNSGSSDHPDAILTDGSIAARSSHPGGVNVLFLDGSTRFVKQTIDLRTWRALASRAGHDVAAIDGL
jgi:prepilin-type N-terminal cleavage/methylation domain-containing protein/prepilin-type processing-associated H-X9-DG protein